MVYIEETLQSNIGFLAGFYILFQVVSGSDHGPERCLKLMVENMPEMAKVLLDKCVATEGSKDSRDYKITYDFFCLEETGTSTDLAQVINRHPLFSIPSQVILLCYDHECSVICGSIPTMT